MRNRFTRITFPVFGGYEVRVILARDMAATGRRLRSDIGGCVAAWVERPGEEMVSYLIIGPRADSGDVAHEASHAIEALFKTVGVRRDEETTAYHLGFLVSRINRFIKGRKNGLDI